MKEIEIEIILGKMNEEFERDFREVTVKYLEEIRKIKNGYVREIRGGNHVGDGNQFCISDARWATRSDGDDALQQEH